MPVAPSRLAMDCVATPPGQLATGTLVQVTAVLVNPAATGSLMAAPVTADGPLLVAVMVYCVVPSPGTLAAGLVLTTLRSATGFTEFVSVASLLPGVGSVVPGGGAIVATLATLPVVAVTFAFTVKVTVPPLGRVGITMPVPSSNVTVVFGTVEQTAPPVVESQVTAVLVKPATTGSVTRALSAALGPLFVTTSV
jgi:hypothetical protein